MRSPTRNGSAQRAPGRGTPSACDGAGVGCVVDEHGELVAAGAGEQVRGDDLAQAGRDRDEQPVAHVAARARRSRAAKPSRSSGAQPEVDRSRPVANARCSRCSPTARLGSSVSASCATAWATRRAQQVSRARGARGRAVRPRTRRPARPSTIGSRGGRSVQAERDGQPLAQQRERRRQHVLGGVPRAGPLAAQAAAEQLAAEPRGTAAGQNGSSRQRGGEPVQQATSRACRRADRLGRRRRRPAPRQSATASSSRSRVSGLASGPHRGARRSGSSRGSGTAGSPGRSGRLGALTRPHLPIPVPVGPVRAEVRTDCPDRHAGTPP